MIIQRCRLKASRINLNHVLILGFLFLGAGFAAAQNLATNPGFETGDTTGWFAFGTPAISAQTIQVHSGSYAGLVTNRTATYWASPSRLSECSNPAKFTMFRRGSGWLAAGTRPCS